MTENKMVLMKPHPDALLALAEAQARLKKNYTSKEKKYGRWIT